MQELLKLIKNSDELPYDLALEAINDIQNSGFSNYRKAAEKILSGAGELLPDNYLRLFIMADITDAEARAAMNRQKRIIEDARFLLPAMLRLTNVKDTKNLEYILGLIRSCCHDFPIITQAVHKKRGHREAVQNLTSMISNLEELVNYLDQNESFVDFDFESQMEFDAGKKVSYSEFVTEVQHMRLAAQYVIFADEIGERE
ncbi:hypothetical protein ATL17_1260 [Maritalea mobilis]|uniref:Uncharacterized protein n=1 Tax=Maritalea mobilis TaxID=483324 RepID=A0A4R6VT48_9HYPH|nr:hypothetical protein [Maritalea mobilis]TDQ67253.1 hypothetical protein ATL17_1260 [Maritalea mobilis]